MSVEADSRFKPNVNTFVSARVCRLACAAKKNVSKCRVKSERESEGIYNSVNVR